MTSNKNIFYEFLVLIKIFIISKKTFMKFNVEDAFISAGNKHKYQKTVLFAIMFTWLSVDFISLVFPLLELEPDYYCKIGEVYISCDNKLACSLPADSIKRIIEYKNILTDYHIDCEKFDLIMLGVSYTVGILIGSFLASIYSDILGRKPVLLISEFSFLIACSILVFAPNYTMILISVFLCGNACSGGTIVSFLYMNEILSKERRSIYGIAISVFFAMAGLLYFFMFEHLKNWKYMMYLCMSFDIISCLLVLFYFVESPRFYFSNKKYCMSLKKFNDIAKKNNKQKEFEYFVKKSYVFFILGNNLDFYFDDIKNGLGSSFSNSYSSANKINNINDSIEKNNIYERENEKSITNKINNFNINLFNSKSSDNINASEIIPNQNNNNKNNLLENKEILDHLELGEIFRALENYEIEKHLEKEKYYNDDHLEENNNLTHDNTQNLISNDPKNTNENRIIENLENLIPNKDNSKYCNTNEDKVENLKKNLTMRGSKSSDTQQCLIKSLEENDKFLPLLHNEEINKLQKLSSNSISNSNEDSESSENFSSTESNPNMNEIQTTSLPRSKIGEKNIISVGFPQNENKILKIPELKIQNHKKHKKPIIKFSSSYFSLIKYPSIRYRFLICNLIWFTYAFTYYGISFYLKKVQGEAFLDGYIIYSAEVISLIITFFIMSSSFFGRVKTLNIMMILAGISTMSYYYMKQNKVDYYEKIPLFLARFSITSINSVMYTYSTEFYPTIIRAKGLGINIFFARLACCFVPILIEIIDNPFIIFSILCLFTSIFTFFLPETMNKELEDEIHEEKLLNNEYKSLLNEENYNKKSILINNITTTTTKKNNF